MLWKLAEAMGLNKQRAHLRRWREAAERIGGHESALMAMSDQDLQAKAASLRQAWAAEPAPKPGRRDPDLEMAFALGREASRRTLGMRHFDVQLIGAMALHEGKLAEMRTGEGKSLCLTLAAIYNCMRGVQTHVVTVNEYLAKRDAVSMEPLYAFFGLQVGLLSDGQELAERRGQYARDIVYGVNHEFGFDYLRHNMASSASERRMVRGLGFAIVDEVDSILIDEARTPLIISGSENDDLSIYAHCWAAACALSTGADLEVDAKARNVIVSEEGFVKLEDIFLGWGLIQKGHHLYEAENNSMRRALQACLSARFLFHRDQHYIVRDGKVMIVDENTGRLMADRRWSNGIHQAMEAKEGVQVLQESKTLATITYQNFFGLYQKLSGLTGTAMTQEAEFWSIYGLESVPVPTHRPMVRVDRPDVVYRSEKEKFKALAQEAKQAVARGRPVLAGTSNIEESEKLSAELDALGVEHRLLNAKNHELEAQIIEEAGLPGRVTVATNMAGRGTDIVLGGTWSMAEAAMEAGEGGPAPDRELLRADWERRRAAILAAGGLLVLGCARNESRRVDNQLRGRSGRQGDAGESKFFISLDDHLFRVYAQNGILAMIDKYNMMPEGSSLEHPMLNRSLDKAQAAVENHHFDMRKQLQDYDGVGAAQRRSVYSWRDDIIDAPEEEVWEMAFAMIEQALDEAWSAVASADFVEAWSSPGAKEALAAIAPLPEEFDRWLDDSERTQEAKDKLLARWRSELEEARDMGWASSEVARSKMLDRIDDAWQEHLTTLQNLLDGIHLRSYAQKDPKQEYKREGYEMFSRLRGAIVAQAASALIGWGASLKSQAEAFAIQGAAALFDGPRIEGADHLGADAPQSSQAMAHWIDQEQRLAAGLWGDGLLIQGGQAMSMQCKEAAPSVQEPSEPASPGQELAREPMAP